MHEDGLFQSCQRRLSSYHSIELLSRLAQPLGRSRLVSEKNGLHVRRHVYSRPFHVQTFVPRFQGRSFNLTFDGSYSLKGTIACGFRYIWQSSFGKNSSACRSRHSTYAFFNRFIAHDEIRPFSRPILLYELSN